MHWLSATRRKRRAYNRVAENGRKRPSRHGLVSSVRHRRWYQYSLRTLMLITLLWAVVCSWFAVKMENARKQREAVDAIQACYGFVYYDDQTDEEGRRQVNPVYSLGSGIAPDRGPLVRLLGRDFFYTARAVYPAPLKMWLLTERADAPVDVSRLLDEEENVEPIDRREKVEPIDKSEMVETLLRALKDLPDLRYLDLSWVPIHDSDVAHLATLRNLRHLDLSFTEVTHEGIARLRDALPNCKIEKRMFLLWD